MWVTIPDHIVVKDIEQFIIGLNIYDSIAGKSVELKRHVSAIRRQICIMFVCAVCCENMIKINEPNKEVKITNK